MSQSLTASREWDEWLTLFANRNDVAYEYATMLELAAADWIGWPLLNAAIIRRWSESGLEYIKRKAWQLDRDRIRGDGDVC